MKTERMKPGGRRKVLITEVNKEKENGIKLIPGQKVFIELEVVENQENLTAIASIDYEDLKLGSSLSGVFQVNSLVFTK